MLLVSALDLFERNKDELAVLISFINKAGFPRISNYYNLCFKESPLLNYHLRSNGHPMLDNCKIKNAIIFLFVF